MNKEEAVRLVMSKYPYRVVDKVTETDKYFLVSIMSKPTKQNVIIRPVAYDDGLIAVDKTTKQVFTYNPIRHG